MDYTFPDYVFTPNYCEIVYTWTATDPSGTAADLTSLISFDGLEDADGVAPDDLTFSFYAPDHALIPNLEETYTISLVATAITTGVVSAPATFDLTVFDPC